MLHVNAMERMTIVIFAPDQSVQSHATTLQRAMNAFPPLKSNNLPVQLQYAETIPEMAFVMNLATSGDDIVRNTGSRIRRGGGGADHVNQATLWPFSNCPGFENPQGIFLNFPGCNVNLGGKQKNSEISGIARSLNKTNNLP